MLDSLLLTSLLISLARDLSILLKFSMSKLCHLLILPRISVSLFFYFVDFCTDILYFLFLFSAYLILFFNFLNEEPQVIDFRSSLCSYSGIIGLFFSCFFPQLTIFDWITNTTNATFLHPGYFWTFINIPELYSGHSKLLRFSLVFSCFCLSSVLQKQHGILSKANYSLGQR